MRISDWSSDVCSSDLQAPLHAGREARTTTTAQVRILDARLQVGGSQVLDRRAQADVAAARLIGAQILRRGDIHARGQRLDQQVLFEIGRASCRERVCQYV